MKDMLAAFAQVGDQQSLELSAELSQALDAVDIPRVKRLLEEGADVNKPMPPSGCTPLHLAVARQNREMINVLLRAGARSGLPDRYGVSAFQAAKRLLPNSTDIFGIDDDLLRKIEKTELSSEHTPSPTV